ncbi:MAG: hypothetical protein JO271_03100 [Verrucomicrobia bacterium]|jgi:hypothetical protein|nr:hypothetical protein [Verrucomicrobiota bacterium]MBV9274153.1 hypothetical protein [Verrucomicrobiota bacterium]
MPDSARAHRPSRSGSDSGRLDGRYEEDNLKNQIKDGKAENADLDRLRYDRLAVEIDLDTLRERISK